MLLRRLQAHDRAGEVRSSTPEARVRGVDGYSERLGDRGDGYALEVAEDEDASPGQLHLLERQAHERARLRPFERDVGQRRQIDGVGVIVQDLSRVSYEAPVTENDAVAIPKSQGRKGRARS